MSNKRATGGDMKKPERKVVLTARIEGDSWDDISDALNSISERIDLEGPITTLISGGWSSGYIADGKTNEDQTGDKYREQNKDYVKGLRDAKSNQCRMTANGEDMDDAFENFIKSRWERLLDNVLRHRLKEAFIAGQKSAAYKCKDLLNQQALAKSPVSETHIAIQRHFKLDR